jgi:G:T-mismatch repair DNA endonuclease (very short patch repair protein)
VKKLRKLGFEVQAQHKIDRFQVDAFLPEEGIVVELYGDYWHANPERYEPDFVHPTTGLTAKETWKRDRKRARKIEKLGYKVMVIWEREMKTLSSSDLKRKLLDGNTEPSRSRK